jgi:hypothetical protein
MLGQTLFEATANVKARRGDTDAGLDAVRASIAAEALKRRAQP